MKVEEQAEKEITPHPVIGNRSYQKYLKENLVRPADEKCAQVKGKVVLTFLVNKEGRPFYIKVKESLCESADKEAIRLIQEGPDWINRNKKAEVTVKFEKWEVTKSKYPYAIRIRVVPVYDGQATNG